jgi:hypothetical protein
MFRILLPAALFSASERVIEKAGATLLSLKAGTKVKF